MKVLFFLLRSKMTNSGQCSKRGSSQACSHFRAPVSIVSLGGTAPFPGICRAHLFPSSCLCSDVTFSMIPTLSTLLKIAFHQPSISQPCILLDFSQRTYYIVLYYIAYLFTMFIVSFHTVFIYFLWCSFSASNNASHKSKPSISIKCVKYITVFYFIIYMYI